MVEYLFGIKKRRNAKDKITTLKIENHEIDKKNKRTKN